MTILARLSNDEVGAPQNLLKPDGRPYRTRAYFTRPRRGLLTRIRRAAIELACVASVIAGVIVAALLAMDLMDMR